MGTVLVSRRGAGGSPEEMPGRGQARPGGGERRPRLSRAGGGDRALMDKKAKRPNPRRGEEGASHCLPFPAGLAPAGGQRSARSRSLLRRQFFTAIPLGT